jgi:hypothetical protein
VHLLVTNNFDIYRNARYYNNKNDHSLSYNIEFKNEWTCNSSLNGAYRETFAFTFLNISSKINQGHSQQTLKFPKYKINWTQKKTRTLTYLSCLQVIVFHIWDLVVVITNIYRMFRRVPMQKILRRYGGKSFLSRNSSEMVVSFYQTMWRHVP